MNRNTEWISFIDEVKQSLPPQMELCAQRAVNKGRFGLQLPMFIKLPVVGLFMVVIIFVALINRKRFIKINHAR